MINNNPYDLPINYLASPIACTHKTELAAVKTITRALQNCPILLLLLLLLNMGNI